MALQIWINGESSEKWTIYGETKKPFTFSSLFGKDIKTIALKATGAELGAIKDQFIGLPAFYGKEPFEIYWFGDDAKFIIANIQQ